jgi:hypothetical protein
LDITQSNIRATPRQVLSDGFADVAQCAADDGYMIF